MSMISGDRERYQRRLSDKIQAAFDHACDSSELEIAAELLSTLETVLLRIPPRPERREAVVLPLLQAHQRLWHLRHRAEEEAGETVSAA